MYIVKPNNKICTCLEWQLSNLSCSYALAVSLELQQNPQDYAKEFYRLDAYGRTYENSIFPPNANDAAQVPFAQGQQRAELQLEPPLQNDPYVVDLPSLLPPIVRRQPGWETRGANEGGNRVKRIFIVVTAKKLGILLRPAQTLRQMYEQWVLSL